MLSHFSIIVATDIKFGIAKNGAMPWHNASDLAFFKDITSNAWGKVKPDQEHLNFVIMGRKTYESLPKERRPLKNRNNVVISTTLKQEENQDLIICESLFKALQKTYFLDSRAHVFVIGGEQVYQEAIKNFIYLCDHLFLTQFAEDYQCDQFFNFPFGKPQMELKNKLERPGILTRYEYALINQQKLHYEFQYFDCLKKILSEGEEKLDRTNIGTLSLFGMQMRFNLENGVLPVFTTKKIFLNSIIEELLFFLSGNTDTSTLKTTIWKDNTSREFLDSAGLQHLKERDMGAGYGFQWRHFGALQYTGSDSDYTGEGIDQIKNVIDQIKKNPHSRRHIVSAWNPAQIKDAALPPCHSFFQFNVSGDCKYLDCQLYCRSNDMFLGCPFNVTSYSLLLVIIAHLTGLKPRNYVHTIGDAHIYKNHIMAVKEQLQRQPYPFPTVSLNDPDSIKNLEDFTIKSFKIQNYVSWPAIKANMAI